MASAARPPAPATPQLLPATARKKAPRSSPAASPRLTRPKEAEQRLDDPALGVHRDLVDRQSAQEMLSLLALGRHTRGIRLANDGAARIDLECLARFGVDEPRDADVGEVALARVFDGQRDDIVPLRQQLERM